LGVVSGRHGVETQTLGTLEEQIELDVSIALDAWVGRLARDVSGDEGRHDVALEFLGVVENVVVDTECLGDATRVVDVGDRAAPRVRNPTPQLQGRAHDFVAGFDQEARGDRRIHATTHRYKDFHPTSLPVASDV
jgi:hypothetical protein